MIRADKLKAAISDLWSDDASQRLRAAENCYKWVSEMEDIRTAQPALTMCLRDPVLAVKKAALTTIEYRAELGADIGMAVPTLESLLNDPDEEISEAAWRAIQFADLRLSGISEVVETCRPDFVFSRSTRTTICPPGGPSISPDINPLTGAWGTEAYASEAAREFLGGLFSSIDVDQKIEHALHQADAYNTIRAAAYLLEAFGIPRIWPGDAHKLQTHIKRAIYLLKAMIDPTLGDPDCEFLERWNHDDEVVISLERQITALTMRLQT